MRCTQAPLLAGAAGVAVREAQRAVSAALQGNIDRTARLTCAAAAQLPAARVRTQGAVPHIGARNKSSAAEIASDAAVIPDIGELPSDARRCCTCCFPDIFSCQSHRGVLPAAGALACCCSGCRSWSSCCACPSLYRADGDSGGDDDVTD